MDMRMTMLILTAVSVQDMEMLLQQSWPKELIYMTWRIGATQIGMEVMSG